jgi:hypothetical protein
MYISVDVLRDECVETGFDATRLPSAPAPTSIR